MCTSATVAKRRGLLTDWWFGGPWRRFIAVHKAKCGVALDITHNNNPSFNFTTNTVYNTSQHKTEQTAEVTKPACRPWNAKEA
jgi:hypothetical protein